MYSPALKERLRKQGRTYYSPARSDHGSQSVNASLKEVTDQHHCASSASAVIAAKATNIKHDITRTTENLAQPSLGTIEQKRDVLRRLRIVERYRKEEALSKVEQLIPKWLSVCQDVAQRVWNLLPEPRPSLAEFLRQLHVDPELINCSFFITSCVQMDAPLWLLCDEGVNIVGMDRNLVPKLLFWDPVMAVSIRNDASVAVLAAPDEPSISSLQPFFDLQSKDGIDFRHIEDAMVTCLASRSDTDVIMERVQRVHKLSANLTDAVLKITDSDRRCHFLNLHYTLNWPVELTWDADLPTSLEISSKQRAPAVFEAFVNHVDAFRDLWNQLKAIDTFACVIDPKQPKFCDIKRQLFLAEHVSMIVTLNLSEPRALPDIQFIGPESQLKRYHDLVNRNLIYWWVKDKNNGVLENLQKLLDGTLSGSDSYDDVELERACNTSLDCLICQCDVDSNGRVADLFCDNCHGAYHAACIRKMIKVSARA
ncbi:hypothetical protein M514_07101 [Trichuris suis]|uniref:FANCL UBC-like domain-containing protein n=1 Tax=Trichuris suis TaxID=68888 RepID=A0A085NPM0_9BILA|nr:hypothetical protein M514_07101 [Trichuris suis]